LVHAPFPAPAGFRIVSSEEIRDGQGTPARVVHPDPGLRITLAPERPMPADWYQFELKFPPEGLVHVVARLSLAGEGVLWLRLPVLARNHFLAHFRLEQALESLTLMVAGSGRLTAPDPCRFERVGLRGQLVAAARRGVDIFRRDGFGVVASATSYLWRVTRPGSIALARGSAAQTGEAPYDAWIRIFDEAPERDRARHAERLATLSRRPLISILALLTPEPSGLDQLAGSVSGQIYPEWELIVRADQHGELAAQLVARGIDRARLRLVNADANAADSLNAMLAAAQGEYVLPLAAGATLRAHALLDLALTAAQLPDAQLIYSDEDCKDASGRHHWRFKPAWSPTLLESTDYLGNPTLMRRATVRELGGWSSAAGAACRHDLLLRLTRDAAPDIVHLAKLLVHSAEPPASPPVRAAPARVLPNPAPRVSLIVPTRDGAEVLATCIRSIRARTKYDDYEIIIVDNGSVQQRTHELFAELRADPAIRILARPEPFNFSRLNNAAAREATGTILGLINNDIEVTHGEWLREMVALAACPATGCVGAKLLYPDGRIQHAGVVVGLGGVAGHAHRFARADDPGYLERLRCVHEVSAVTAACLLIRREVFDSVGGLDEELTVAFNDVDLCLRVREAGYRNLWTPFADLIHHESASRGSDITPAKARRFAQEYAAMQRRWGAALLNDPYYSPHLTYDREEFSLRLR
jgi:GT2 family glycosyltransferase